MVLLTVYDQRILASIAHYTIRRDQQRKQFPLHIATFMGKNGASVDFFLLVGENLDRKVLESVVVIM
jgi:hypothetical protein